MEEKRKYINLKINVVLSNECNKQALLLLDAWQSPAKPAPTRSPTIGAIWQIRLSQKCVAKPSV